MSDIFKEVDEEVRRDQALAFWNKHQNNLIALALVIIAAAGGWRWYQTQQRAAAEAAGARYEAAVQLAREDKSAEADAAFQEIIRQGPTGYALLARFRGAAEIAKTDKAKAVSIFDGIANDAGLDVAMRDIARLRAAMLRIDDADAAEIKSRLEPLAAPGAPFRNTARELLAFAALKAEDFDAAARWLDAIVVDAQAPQSIKSRAEALIGLVSAGK